MDHNGKCKRFLWVDWVILITAVCLAAVAIWGWSASRQKVEQTRDISYTLCISNLENVYFATGLEELLPIGGCVMNANGTAVMGEVRAVWTRPAVEPCVQDQAVSFAKRQDRSDVLVRVSAKASERAGDGFRVRDIRISAGKSGDFRIGGLYAPNALIVSVEWEAS